MKTFAIIIAALMIGYMLGSLAPNAKLEKARDEISSLKDDLKNSSRKKKSPLSGVNTMLDISANEVSKSTSHKYAKKPVPDPLAIEEKTNTVTFSIGTDGVSTSVSNTVENSDNSFSNELELAASAWGVRSELARNAFIENAELDDGETARFNVLVDSMNIRLEETVYEWVDKISAEDFGMASSEELGIRMMNDFAEVMVLTFDEMDRNMPAGWREAAGDNFEFTSLIDPDVIKPLIDVEDRLDF